MEASAKTTPAADEMPEKKRRFRVPTPVLVTIALGALPVWIAHAFTRQWDDRQRARELRVTISQEMISASTRVIYAATEPPLGGHKPAANFDAVLARWDRESAILGTKLRAYFSPQVSEHWDRFDA